MPLVDERSPTLRVWSASLEDRVCGPGLTWRDADLPVPGTLTGAPRCSPHVSAQSDTSGARAGPCRDLPLSPVGAAPHAVGRYDWLARQRIDSTGPYSHDIGRDAERSGNFIRRPRKGSGTSLAGISSVARLTHRSLVGRGDAHKRATPGASRRIDP